MFITHLRDVTKDAAVRAMADEILADEEDHEEWLDAKLARIADDESRRGFLEEQFVESWSSQQKGVVAEARELGIDVERVLTAAGFAIT